MDGMTDSMDVSLSKLKELMIDEEAWHVAIYGATESDMTEQLNLTEVRSNFFTQQIFMEYPGPL